MARPSLGSSIVAIVAWGSLVSFAGAVRPEESSHRTHHESCDSSQSVEGLWNHTNSQGFSRDFEERCCCPESPDDQTSMLKSYKAMCFWNLQDPGHEKSPEGRLMMFLRREKEGARQRLDISVEELKSMTSADPEKNKYVAPHFEIEFKDASDTLISEPYPDETMPFDEYLRHVSSQDIPGVGWDDPNTVQTYLNNQGSQRGGGILGQFTLDGSSAWGWYCNNRPCKFHYDTRYQKLCYQLACKDLNLQCTGTETKELMETYSVTYFERGLTGGVPESIPPSVCLTTEGSGPWKPLFQKDNPGTLKAWATAWGCPDWQNLKTCTRPTTTCASNQARYRLGSDKCTVSEEKRMERAGWRQAQAVAFNIKNM